MPTELPHQAWPRLKKSEWEEFQHEITLALIKNPSTRVGRLFVCYFPEVSLALRENSNLGTPPGVYNPSDDVILEGTKGANEAYAFIIDRVEIIEDEEWVEYE